jgi:hypothetical protein
MTLRVVEQADLNPSTFSGPIASDPPRLAAADVTAYGSFAGLTIPTARTARLALRHRPLARGASSSATRSRGLTFPTPLKARTEPDADRAGTGPDH